MSPQSGNNNKEDASTTQVGAAPAVKPWQLGVFKEAVSILEKQSVLKAVQSGRHCTWNMGFGNFAAFTSRSRVRQGVSILLHFWNQNSSVPEFAEVEFANTESAFAISAC